MLELDEYALCSGVGQLDQPVTIIDRGRGPQLSSSRITVQDVYPYLKKQLTYGELRELLPTLTELEFKVIAAYVADPRDEVEAVDRAIQERNTIRASQSDVERLSRLKRLDQVKKDLKNLAGVGE